MSRTRNDQYAELSKIAESARTFTAESLARLAGVSVATVRGWIESSQSSVTRRDGLPESFDYVPPIADGRSSFSEKAWYRFEMLRGQLHQYIEELKRATGEQVGSDDAGDSRQIESTLALATDILARLSRMKHLGPQSLYISATVGLVNAVMQLYRRADNAERGSIDAMVTGAFAYIDQALAALPVPVVSDFLGDAVGDDKMHRFSSYLGLSGAHNLPNTMQGVPEMKVPEIRAETLAAMISLLGTENDVVPDSIASRDYWSRELETRCQLFDREDRGEL